MKMDVAQTASFISSMTYEPGVLEYEDLPKTDQPVWILGCQYSVLYDLEELKSDMRSRLWFTYRTGFSAIGGQGPTQDKGWGCMLRCGQMLLCQALTMRHLGRDWRWIEDKYDPKYHEILRMFLDKKGSCYSIHQIASMGATEGKSVGEWFGPNTIAHVLKKLAVYDEWSSITIHVAMDNTVIMEDIRTLCRCRCLECSKSGKTRSKVGSRSRRTDRPAGDNSPGATFQNGDIDNRSSSSANDTSEHSSHTKWKPLLLIIPLRLGLTEVNQVYIPSLKVCLTLKQTVGIIGGKPSHAHWFVGFLEDEIIFLDPHTTQPFVDLSQAGETDSSYHCPYVCRMNITELDPSIALGFYFKSESDFDDWCKTVSKLIMRGQKTPMFELYERRPRHWPPFEPYDPSVSRASVAGFTVLGDKAGLADRQFDTDDEFELL